MALEVRIECVVSSLLLLLVEAFEVFEVLLAFPGDLDGGERPTKELISTLATAAGSIASTFTSDEKPSKIHATVDSLLPVETSSR